MKGDSRVLCSAFCFIPEKPEGQMYNQVGEVLRDSEDPLV